MKAKGLIRDTRNLIGRIFSLIARPFSKFFGKTASLLPRSWRVRLYHFKRSRKVRTAGAFILIILIGTVSLVLLHKYLQKEMVSTLPYNEKIAEGAYIKHNQDREHYNFGENKDSGGIDLNLKEVVNINEAFAEGEEDGDIASSFDTLRFKWVVTLPSGTNFEFGGVTKDTPDGKVLPVVRVRNKSGVYLAYAPSSGLNPVTPKVNGNVVEWEIVKGITARYTMQSDRVKADYIVDEASSLRQLASGSKGLQFDFEYEGGELVQDPDGGLSLVSGSGRAFRIPLPVILESGSKNQESWTGSYNLTQAAEGKAKVAIILPEEQLEEAEYPLTVDPVVIDSSATTTGTAYGNSRSLVRDTWGNLIAIFDGGTGDDNVYYKNYNSSSWTDANINLDDGTGSASNPTADIDSSGDVHVAFYNTGESDLEYTKLNIYKNGNNSITGITKDSNEDIDTTSGTGNVGKASLIVANKGGGEGAEKVVITYSMQQGTSRSEARTIQKDIYDLGYEETIRADSNLVGYWRLNEQAGTNANDLSATSNDGTYTGGYTLAQPGVIAGDEDKATDFNGSTGYVTIADNNAYTLGTTNKLSVAFWSKPDTAETGDGVVVGKGAVSNFEWAIFREPGTDAYYTVIYQSGGASSATAPGITGFAPGDKHFVVVTMDEDTDELFVYVDGELSGSDTTWTGSRINGTAPLNIGRRGDAMSYYDGIADEVAIFNDILTEGEIDNLYNLGRESIYKDMITSTPGLVGYWRLGEGGGTVAEDISVTGNDGTYFNTPTLGAASATGSDTDTAATFDGSTEYVSVPDNNAYDMGTGDYSLEIWMNRSSAATNQEYLLGHEGNGGSTDWELSWNPGSNTFVSRPGLSPSCTSAGGVNYDDGRWHHVVVTMDRDGLCTWYVDGVVNGTPTDISSASSANLTNTSVLYIGRRNLTTCSDDCYFTGSLDEVAIYKGVVLTPDQVLDHYQAANDWKNASEEKNSNGTCSDSTTSGDSGIPNAYNCRGSTDRTGFVAASTTIQGVVGQMPGTPKRSPDSVKWDDNSSFSNLTSAIDGSASSTSDVSGFTTADYIYIGDSDPFSKVTLDITNTNSNSSDFATTDVEYCALSYNGTSCDSWVDLTNFGDNTDSGSSSFAEDGSIFFDQEPDWVTHTVDSVTGKYWIRVRPDAAMDASVSIAEITVNNRNSDALIVMNGDANQSDLDSAYVVWDDIRNDTWENNPSSAGVPWRESSPAVNIDGGAWGTYSNFPLSSAVDFKNNNLYVSFIDIAGTDSLDVITLDNNKDPTVAANWTDTDFPSVTEGTDLVASLTTDEEDVYLFYVLDPGTNNLVYRKCSPYAAADPKKCDSTTDWGSEKVVYGDTTVSHPNAIVTKKTSDIVAFDMLFTDTTDSDVLHERVYSEGFDKEAVVSASTDDSFHRDCVSGTDDSDVTWTGIVVGLDQSDGQCVGSVDADDHGGFRFPSIAVAPGAKISSAYIEVKVQRVWGSGNAVDFTIYGEDTDDSSSFPSSTNCTDPCSGAVGERTRTTSSNVQSVDFEGDLSAYGPGLTYRFDVTDLVQEIICRGVIGTQPCVGNFNGSGAWASGNDLAILMISNEAEDNQVEFFSYDHTTTANVDAKLVINCGDSCSEPKPQESNWCNIGTAGGNGAADCNNNWESRKKITLDNRASSENLTNFPVLIRLDSTKIDYSKVADAGEDLRFVDADGTTLLDYDIEEWNESGESLVWVEIPQIDSGSNSDYIYMYYNNTATGTYWEEVIADSPTVLLKMDEASGSLVDTQVGNNAAVSGTALKYRAPGPSSSIPYAAKFSSGTIATISDGTDVDLGNGPFTIEMWIQRPTNGGNYSIVQKNADGTGTDGYEVWFHGASNSYRSAQGDGTNHAIGDADTDNGWHHYVFTRGSGTAGKVYRDGVDITDSTASLTFTNNNDNLIIGNIFEGSIAGLAIYKSELSQTRVQAHFNSIGTVKGVDETGTWDSNYELVQHLEEDPTGTCSGSFEFCDSTSNNAHADEFGAWESGDQVNGVVNGGVATNAVDSNGMSGSDAAFPSGTSAVTFEGWIRSTATNANTDILGYGNTAPNPDQDYNFGMDDGRMFLKVDNANPTTYTFGNTGDNNDGEWHHLAVTFSGTSTPNGYIDGVPVSSNNAYVSNSGMTLSSYDIGLHSGFTDKILDEVRLSSGVRSAEWMEANYLTQRPGSTFASIAEEETDPTTSEYESLITSDANLAGYWRLGELSGTNANDLSSNNGDGTYANTPVLGVSGAILGDKDTAVTFDGSTENVNSVGDSSGLPSGNAARSMEAWFKTTHNADSFSRAIFGYGEQVNKEDINVYVSDGSYCVLIRAAPDFNCFTSTDTVNDGVWHHGVVTYDGTDFKAYIDGVKVGSDWNPTNNPNTDTTFGWQIGEWSHWFSGSIDEVAVYSDVLTEAEILSHYNTGRASLYRNTITTTPGLTGYWRLGEGGGTVAEDLSATGNDGTYTNTPTLGVTGAIQGDNDTAATFTAASSEYVVATDNNAYDVGSGDFSLEIWFKYTSAGSTSDWLISKDNQFALFVDSTGDLVLDNFVSHAADSRITVNGDTNWHHAVATRTGNTYKLYFDGEDVTGVTATQTFTANSSNLYIGVESSLGSQLFFPGSLDEAAIYNVALTGDQVREHYLAGAGTNKYSTRNFSKGVTDENTTSFSDLDASFSSADYVAVQGNDENYVNVSTDLNIHASTSAVPAYVLKVNNANNGNSDEIDVTAVVRSNVSASDYPIRLQVYRGGSTDDWVTIDSDTATAGNTDITLTSTIDTDLTEYYINDTPGIGTQGAECAAGTANCWVFFRVYQDNVGNNYNVNFGLDAFDAGFTETGPSQVSFTNEHRYFPTNVCSGAGNPFTIEVQDAGGGPVSPTQSTVVRVTSSTLGSFTVYSDATCSTTVTNGDFTFGVGETSKTFYILDTGISNDYQLRATVQSGDALTTGVQNYTVEGGPREDSRVRIRGGGDTRIRGGVRIP